MKRDRTCGLYHAMLKLNAWVVASVSLFATACVMDEESIELEDDATLDAETLEQEAPETGVIAACAWNPPVAEVTDTAVWPGVAQHSLTNSYATSGDGYFTMHVNGASSFDEMWGRAALSAASTPDTKAACDTTYARVTVWAKRITTGCWAHLGSTTSYGDWHQDTTYPFTSSFCTVRSDVIVDGNLYSQVRVGAYAARKLTYPLVTTIPLAVQSILVTDT